jgi:RimJ/RimL family protein N-acetyltransferase
MAPRVEPPICKGENPVPDTDGPANVMPAMPVVETPRLALRRLSSDHEEFIRRLLNEPSFLRYIGDRKVRTASDAVRYIETGPVAMYAQFGFGLFLVELKATGAPIGICGLLKRDTLDDVDVGFAFLPEYWRQGYAFESAAAVIEYGRTVHRLARVVAITSLDNPPSISLLEKLGFRFERTIRMTSDGEELRLFGLNTNAPQTETTT